MTGQFPSYPGRDLARRLAAEIERYDRRPYRTAIDRFSFTLNEIETPLMLSLLRPVAQGSGGCGAWQPIETAPKDGTRIIGSFWSIRWADSHRKGDVVGCWYQPEFDAFISSCREMSMHNGYTFEDGATKRLHSPVIEPITHWMPMPDGPAVPSTSQLTAAPIDEDTPTCVRCGARIHSPCQTDAQEDRCELPSGVAVSSPESK